MKGYTHRMLVTATLLLPLLLSCDKETTEGNAGGAQLVLNTEISGSSISSETKGAVTGTKFTKDKTIGLCIYVHEDTPTKFEPHLLGYGNIKATSTDASGDTWNFYNEAIKVTVPKLYLTTRSDKATADIYAYSPYIKDLTNIQAIPVDFSKNQDIMYASQNGMADKNKNLDPEAEDGKTIEVPLTFVHKMSRLRFGFKLENAGSDHLMNYITIKKTNSKTTPIYSGGTFNALDGSFKNVQSAESVTVLFGTTNNNTEAQKERYGIFDSKENYRYFDYLLYPTDYQNDGDFTVVFSIDGFPYEYVIKRADVLHSDGTTYGFKAGCSYDFNFKFDNYVHLKDITIQEDWTPDQLEGII